MKGKNNYIMCIICVELDKNKLSPWEAKANLSEMADEIGPEHTREVEDKISDAILEEVSLNYGDVLDEAIQFTAFCSRHAAHNTKND